MGGNFGGKQISVGVTRAPGNVPVPGGIQVTVLPGSSIGKSSNGNLITGKVVQDLYGDGTIRTTLPARAGKDTIQHEAFHEACYPCDYPGHGVTGTSIMNYPDARGTPRSIDATTWGMALGSIPTVSSSSPKHELSFGDYSNFSLGGSSGGGAFGGFLLYQNKPNNNMMQSVYSK